MLVRHRSATGSWELASAPPAATLRPHVRGYTGYAEDMAAPLRRRELPNGGVTLIVSFGPSIDVAGAGRLTSFVAGIDDGYAITEHDGRQHGVQVDLGPLGARMLLGLPMRELARAVVALDDLLGPAAAELAERLAGAPAWPERFALLDATLAARLSRAPRPPAHIAWALARIEGAHGDVRVADLAAELGCSRRHLTATFGEEVGLAPKALARVLRFRRAVALLRSGRAGGLAAIAQACGYADQPHLNRDFRALAGVTPTAYAAGLAQAGACPEPDDGTSQSSKTAAASAA